MDTCPECGAHLTTTTCREQFDLCLLKEVEDPRYYAAHHLIVPAYMLQHNIYSSQGWREVRKLLGEFLGGLSPEAARKRYKQDYNSHSRNFRITGGRDAREREGLQWSVTIADVRLDTPEHYISDVHRLAQAVLDDTTHISDLT